MKKKKSLLSILGVLILSFSFMGGASAQCTASVTPLCGGGSTKPEPPKCLNGYCPLPTSIIPEVE